MKQVKLSIYNYGIYPVADFKNNYHDAMQCMQAMNQSLITTYGKLPESIFYFITYKIKTRKIYFIEAHYDKLTLSDIDLRVAKLPDLNPDFKLPA